MTRSENEGAIRIEITEAQKKQIEQATGKQVSTLVLKLEPLEERSAPRIIFN